MAVRKGRKPTLTVDHRVDLHFEVDSEKVAAIKRCLERGRLTITVSKVDLTSAASGGDPYQYD